MLQNVVYGGLGKFLGDWGKLIEALLQEKEDFHSHLSTDDTTDADCVYAKRVCWGFEIKSISEYDYSNVPNNILFLANVFENLQNLCFKIY